MPADELAPAVIIFALSAGLAVISVLQFLQKGPLLNNAWLWASPEERETLDKKPHYRQSGVVFAALSAVFLLAALNLVTGQKGFFIASLVLTGAVLVYAVVSSVLIEKNIKRKKGE